MNTANHKIDDQLLDDAAAEALGTSSPAESAAYQRQLAAEGGNVAVLDRQLQETVARMAAASPYMSPPSHLRGRVLQATAPATFRMEEYRKATSDNGRFYRWGFYAAMFFLMAGAWYNVNLQGSLNTANQRAVAVARQDQRRDAALASLVNPNADQITLLQNGKVTGKAYVDDKSNNAIVVLPDGLLPPDQGVQLTLNRNGKKVAYNTIVIAASRDFFPDAAAKLGTSFAVNDVQPDATPKTVFHANMNP